MLSWVAMLSRMKENSPEREGLWQGSSTQVKVSEGCVVPSKFRVACKHTVGKEHICKLQPLSSSVLPPLPASAILTSGQVTTHSCIEPP
jgi:hypothetical protein